RWCGDGEKPPLRSGGRGPIFLGRDHVGSAAREGPLRERPARRAHSVTPVRMRGPAGDAGRRPHEETLVSALVLNSLGAGRAATALRRQPTAAGPAGPAYMPETGSNAGKRSVSLVPLPYDPGQEPLVVSPVLANLDRQVEEVTPSRLPLQLLARRLPDVADHRAAAPDHDPLLPLPLDDDGGRDDEDAARL